MVSTEQPQLSSVVEDEAEKESRRTESLPQYDAAITEYERHPAAGRRRRPQATDSTCFKSSQSLYLWLGVKRAPRRKCEKVPR